MQIIYNNVLEFPDLEGCLSSGDTIDGAYENAKEALGLYLDREDDIFDRIINESSSINKVHMNNPDDIVMLVECDSLKFTKLIQ